MKTNRIVMITLGLIVVSMVASGVLFADGMTSADLLAEAKSNIQTVSVTEAKDLFDQGGYLFIDVREPNETAMGTIPGAIQIPRGLLEFRIANTVEDQNANIVVYCKSGGRSSLATYTLVRMGYDNAVSMDGGWGAWEEAAYPVE
jgi:rhodanese-related sulfurtransferase